MKLFLLTLMLAWSASPIENLPASKIPELKQKPCTFLHVWATWCTPCLQELPQLLELLRKLKGVNPVIIDVSPPFQQDNFSKKWMRHLNPPFATYVKPRGPDEPYLAAIDKGWTGTLPFTAVYDQGKKKKQWIGTLDLANLAKELEPLCKHGWVVAPRQSM